MVYKSKVVGSFGPTLQVALSFLEGIGSARSLSVWLLARRYLLDEYLPDLFAGELDSLGFSINWYDQFSIDEFRDDYQATVLFSKLPPATVSTHLRVSACRVLWRLNGVTHSRTDCGYLIAK